AFNADAVIHHWNRVLSPKRKFKGLLFGDPVDSVEKVDDHTVRFWHVDSCAAVATLDATRGD
ncbi:MAG: hypothetical protein GY842_24830, partial [bacterium]|nr:hypothetical protein [bacterium]